MGIREVVERGKKKSKNTVLLILTDMARGQPDMVFFPPISEVNTFGWMFSNSFVYKTI